MNAFYWVLTLMLLGFGSQDREGKQTRIADRVETVIQQRDVPQRSRLEAKGRKLNHIETLVRDTNE